MAVLENGNFVIVWYEDGAGLQNSKNIFGQLFDFMEIQLPIRRVLDIKQIFWLMSLTSGITEIIKDHKTIRT